MSAAPQGIGRRHPPKSAFCAVRAGAGPLLGARGAVFRLIPTTALGDSASTRKTGELRLEDVETLAQAEVGFESGSARAKPTLAGEEGSWGRPCAVPGMADVLGAQHGVGTSAVLIASHVKPQR